VPGSRRALACRASDGVRPFFQSRSAPQVVVGLLAVTKMPMPGMASEQPLISRQDPQAARGFTVTGVVADTSTSRRMTRLWYRPARHRASDPALVASR
jgi:hypothetical protein